VQPVWEGAQRSEVLKKCQWWVYQYCSLRRQGSPASRRKRQRAIFWLLEAGWKLCGKSVCRTCLWEQNSECQVRAGLQWGTGDVAMRGRPVFQGGSQELQCAGQFRFSILPFLPGQEHNPRRRRQVYLVLLMR